MKQFNYFPKLRESNRNIETHIIRLEEVDAFAVLSWHSIDKKVYVKYYSDFKLIQNEVNLNVTHLYEEAAKFCEENKLTLWSY